MSKLDETYPKRSDLRNQNAPTLEEYMGELTDGMDKNPPTLEEYMLSEKEEYMLSEKRERFISGTQDAAKTQSSLIHRAQVASQRKKREDKAQKIEDARYAKMYDVFGPTTKPPRKSKRERYREAQALNLARIKASESSIRDSVAPVVAPVEQRSILDSFLEGVNMTPLGKLGGWYRDDILNVPNAYNTLVETGPVGLYGDISETVSGRAKDVWAETKSSAAAVRDVSKNTAETVAAAAHGKQGLARLAEERYMASVDLSYEPEPEPVDYPEGTEEPGTIFEAVDGGTVSDDKLREAWKTSNDASATEKQKKTADALLLKNKEYVIARRNTNSKSASVSDDKLREAWKTSNDASATEKQKKTADALLLKNKEYVIAKRNANRKSASESIDDRLRREKYTRKYTQNISDDLKHLGLPSNDKNVAAMAELRNLGLDGWDMIAARTQFQRDGKDKKWNDLDILGKVGYTHLHTAVDVLDGNSGRFFSKSNGSSSVKGREVAKVRTLQKLVEAGRITPQELVTGNGITYKRGGKTRINIPGIDAILYKKKNDLDDMATSAKMAGHASEYNRAIQEKENISRYERYMAGKEGSLGIVSQMGVTEKSHGGVTKSELTVMDDWREQRDQIMQMPAKRRATELFALDLDLENWGISRAKKAAYMQTAYGIYSKGVTLGKF